MVCFTSYVSVTLAVAGYAAGVAIPASGGMKAAQAPKALYFMTNAAENSIVALPIGEDGKLSDGTITPTGGKGAQEVDATTGIPNAPDGLASQGAVKVAGGMVFAVNPGSNTVSMLSIDEQDPTKLTLVGEPADTLGEFPVSLAVSRKHGMVCVGNTGAKAGVACGSICGSEGIGAMDALRPFELNQKTPPTGPLNSVADLFFNEKHDILLATVKGDPTVNNTGFISAFSVQNGAVSMQDTRSSPNGTAVLFGSVNIHGTNNILATDASFGAGILSIGKDNKISLKTATKVDDQKATCWSTISKKTGTGFVTDVAVNHLVEMDLTTGAIIKKTNLDTTNPGLIDVKAAGDFMYALSPGNANVTSAVAVFDLSGGKGTAKQIQNFNPKGVTDSAQGMAVLHQ